MSRLFLHPFHERNRIQFRFAAGTTVGIHGFTHESHIVDARQLHGILHAEEDAAVGTLLGGQGQQVLAVETDLAARDLVAVPSRQYMGQGTLARAIGAHDGVHLAGGHLQVQPLQYGLAVDAGVQILDG